MTTAPARWTGGVALFASVCAAVVGLGAQCAGAETPRVAEVIAVGPRSAWTQPLALDCAATPQPANAPLAVLRYRDGSRYERRWRTARIPAPAGTRVGDRLRFDPAACRAYPADL